MALSALGATAFHAFDIAAPLSELVVGMLVVAVVAALPIAVAGLGTGNATFVLVFRDLADPETLLALSLANPLSSFKIAAISAITGSLDVLGPAGVYATRSYGSGLLPLLAGLLVAWSLVPLLAAGWIFDERGIQ